MRAAVALAPLLLATACFSSSGELTEQQARARCADALVASARDLGRGARPELLSTDFDPEASAWRCEFGRNGRTQVRVVLYTRTGTFEVSRG
jgi:hypothetical protein